MYLTVLGCFQKNQRLLLIFQNYNYIDLNFFRIGRKMGSKKEYDLTRLETAALHEYLKQTCMIKYAIGSLSLDL